MALNLVISSAAAKLISNLNEIWEFCVKCWVQFALPYKMNLKQNEKQKTIDFNQFFFFGSDSSISTRVDMLTPAIEVGKPPLWHKDETVESHLGKQSTSSDL